MIILRLNLCDNLYVGILYRYFGVFAPCKNCEARETALLSNTRTQQ
jgi:translation initiation factor 2 beta subunit (eIF-2beta)/eIF-5